MPWGSGRLSDAFADDSEGDGEEDYEMEEEDYVIDCCDIGEMMIILSGALRDMEGGMMNL